MGLDKVLTPLNGKPLFLYVVETLVASAWITEVVVVIRSEIRLKVEDYLRTLKTPKPLDVVVGGHERYQSVYNALEFLDRQVPPDFVLIQDAARPFLHERLIVDSIRAASDTGGSCVAVCARDTLKSSQDGVHIAETVDRSRMWQAQTPQTFRFSMLYKAYKELKDRGDLARVTDDASVAERFGCRVRIVKGSFWNIKITHAEDLTVAAALQQVLSKPDVSK